MKKLPVVVVVLAGALVAGWWGWRRQHRVVNASELILYGNVDIRQVALAFEGNGRIAELKVEEGDRVHAGQVIAVLDTKTLEIEARQVEAEIEVRKQSLLRLQHGSRPEEISRARSQLKAAEATARRADLDFERSKKLFATGAVTEQDFEHATSSADTARATVDDLRASLRLSILGPRAEDIGSAAAQLEASKVQLAQLRHQIDQGQLRAPVDAIVRSRLQEPGDMISPQKAVYALAVTRPKWIRVYVSEPDLGKLKPGMPARAVTDSHPAAPIAGKLGFISSVAEFTPKSVQTEELRSSLVYEARVIVEDDADALRLGQPVTVYLPLTAKP
ncbi:MAG TPA: HlyD family efflux transporter periplasmic adaptor subunit [Polyangiaceae bacterium]|nr:HlyD family efflux transporter periplasmic adaptor subunit [Polyangiaceae bacterium]